MSFSFDKVTPGTNCFVSVILNSNPIGRLFAAAISAKAQFLDQVKINSTSQLINGMVYLKPSKNYLNVLVE